MGATSQGATSDSSCWRKNWMHGNMFLWMKRSDKISRQVVYLKFEKAVAKVYATTWNENFTTRNKLFRPHEIF